MSYVPPKSWLCNPLNTSKYLKLDKDERKFFKLTTKIEDDVELDQHILDVQAQAYKVGRLRFETCHGTQHCPAAPQSRSTPSSLQLRS